jgi:hypothetical protein
LVQPIILPESIRKKDMKDKGWQNQNEGKVKVPLI